MKSGTGASCDSHPSPFVNQRVFIVADDAAERVSLTRMLARQGWKAEAYESAESFLESASLDGPGCVILDLQLTGMSGQELIDRLVATGCPLSIIAMSGTNDVAAAVRAMHKGAVTVLLKPFNPSMLCPEIESALKRSAKLSEARRLRNRSR